MLTNLRMHLKATLSAWSSSREKQLWHCASCLRAPAPRSLLAQCRAMTSGQLAAPLLWGAAGRRCQRPFSIRPGAFELCQGREAGGWTACLREANPVTSGLGPCLQPPAAGRPCPRPCSATSVPAVLPGATAWPLLPCAATSMPCRPFLLPEMLPSR